MPDELKDNAAEEPLEASAETGVTPEASLDEPVQVAPEPETQEIAPGLKLAEIKDDVPVAEATATASSQAEARDSVPTPAGKSVSRRFGLTALNRCLAALVVIIICLAGFEVWSNVLAIQIPEPPPAILIADGEESDYSLPPIEDILKAFIERPIIIDPDQTTEIVDPVGGQPPPPPPPGLIKYARDNFDLIGRSDGEAIVLDKKTGKMFFLKVGGEIPVNDQTLKLDQIGADHVEFTDGTDRVTVK